MCQDPCFLNRCLSSTLPSDPVALHFRLRYRHLCPSAAPRSAGTWSASRAGLSYCRKRQFRPVPPNRLSPYSAKSKSCHINVLGNASTCVIQATAPRGATVSTITPHGKCRLVGPKLDHQSWCVDGKMRRHCSATHRSSIVCSANLIQACPNL